ncbi:MAG: hypothetical protein RID09_08430 [Coleofasciculus sp. G1-WW12-02]|uniref:hypothetical protein n=1 Tax=Coleofasciculus sp. G1-WW12-02 TaxID=3068483 RepID=UPI0032F4E53F
MARLYTKPALLGEQEEMRKNFSYSPITNHQSPILAIAKWQQGMRKAKVSVNFSQPISDPEYFIKLNLNYPFKKKSLC